jgi:hypothetical protein
MNVYVCTVYTVYSVCVDADVQMYRACAQRPAPSDCNGDMDQSSRADHTEHRARERAKIIPICYAVSMHQGLKVKAYDGISNRHRPHRGPRP